MAHKIAWIFVAFLSLGAAFIPAPASAATGSKLITTLVAMGVQSKPEFSGTSATGAKFPSYTVRWGYGGGALFGIPVLNSLPGPIDSIYKVFRTLNLDLEIGALYFLRKFELTGSPVGGVAGPSIGGSQRVLQIPVLLRFGGPLGLYLGAGGYYSINRSIGTTEFAGQEVGGVASFQLYLGKRFGYGFVVDGRYTFSLSDATHTAAAKTTMSDYQVLTGIRF